MRLEPATIKSDIIQSINSLLSSEHRYLSVDDIRYRKILRECDKLIQADPVQGYIARGMARSVVGDIEMGELDFANALKLAPSLGDDVRFAWAHFMLNMGAHSSALSLFRQAVSPAKPEFSQRHEIGEVIGAVAYLSDSFKEAESMRLQYETPMDVNDAHTKAVFLKERGVDDDKLALALDLAGEVVRKRRLIPGNAHVSGIMDLDGDMCYVAEFHLNCSAKEAAEMVYELSEKMALLDEDEAYHSIHITFKADNGGH